jgi:bromodomain-containing factor 1
VATPVPVPPAQAVAPKKVAQSAITRRPSTSVPVIRRSEAEAVGRPKREIHPPPPKDLPYADAPKKHRKTKRIKDDGTIEQLKYCGKILQELHRKQHYNYAHPFYEPVGKYKRDSNKSISYFCVRLGQDGDSFLSQDRQEAHGLGNHS